MAPRGGFHVAGEALLPGRGRGGAAAVVGGPQDTRQILRLQEREEAVSALTLTLLSQYLF